jgi:hypothetical protein
MDLDRVFAGVPRVGVAKGCGYCYPEVELEMLGGDPALVPDDLVEAFARETLDHWSQDHYGLVWRGLAPRILAAVEAAPDELLLRGLPYARFSTWPDEQRLALREAVGDILTRAVTGGRTPETVVKLICTAAHVDQDLTPWLRHLDSLTGAEADAGIAALVEYWAPQIGGGYEPTLWFYPDDPAQPVRDWLRSDTLHRRLSRMDAQAALAALAWV